MEATLATTTHEDQADSFKELRKVRNLISEIMQFGNMIHLIKQLEMLSIKRYCLKHKHFL